MKAITVIQPWATLLATGKKHIETRSWKTNYRGEQKEAISVGIATLALQTPRVASLEGDGYSDGHLVYDTWICPNCESSYEMDYEEHKFCPNCGQKIDWEGIKSDGEDHSI